MALIPGTVGAAPIQNIGAYGVELSEFVETVEAFRRDTGQVKRLAAADCGFGYRDSLFKRDADRWVVTALELRLPRTRELQEEQALRNLVGVLREAQERLGAQHGRRVPMLVKIAPDLTDEDIESCARVLGDLHVDGVIATNTTVDRLPVEGHRHAGEAGGLSGAPLYGKSTAVLRRLRGRLDPAIPLIGVGGILNGADAAGKIAAGATMVQFYSGMVYRGPELVGECVDAIRRRRENVG